MAELLNRKAVKVRKRHKCQGCGEAIQIGEKANVSVVVGSDGIFSFYECDPCRVYADNECDKCKDFDYCIGENYSIGSLSECQRERQKYLSKA